VSCPNVVTDDGGRKPILGHDFESMAAIADMIVDEFDEEDIFIGVKMPPYRSVSEIEVQRNIGRVLNDGVIDYIATSNTIPGGQPVNEHGENILTVPNGIGGMSGPATKTEGRAQLSSWKSLVMDNILVLGCTPVPIMSTLGIYNGEEMQVRRMLGADVVSMNTRLWNSTNWKATVSEILAEFAEFES
jgi:dihydroorotate dehydrogenase